MAIFTDYKLNISGRKHRHFHLIATLLKKTNVQCDTVHPYYDL